MTHGLIRATILPQIISLISETYNVSDEIAMDMFYSSVTAINFGDDETGLYGQSPLFIFGLFQQEMGMK